MAGQRVRDYVDEGLRGRVSLSGSSPANREMMRGMLPLAEVRFLEAGHSALESHGQEIAEPVRDFLGRMLLD